MSTPFVSSQTYRTNPEPYDQIFVLSQKIINDALRNMWNLAPRGSPLLSYQLRTRDGQELNCQLKAPIISLQVNDQESVQLYYHLQMQSGLLSLFTSMDSSNNNMKLFDVTDWSIAVPVKISRKIIKKGDQEFPYYANKTGFKNDAFSIAQLYIDSSTSAALFDMDKSSFNGLNWKDESKGIRQNFDMFVSQWIAKTSEEKANIIGAQILANGSDSVNSAAPSFVPTSIDYYNYPWHDPSSDPYGTGKKLDGLDQNALCYLTVSDFAKPPEPVGLRFSGTFVEDGGVLCMNQRLFWGKWMLPLLQKVNKRLQLIPVQPYLVPSSDPVWDTDCLPEFAFGANPAHPSDSDPYFAFSNRSWNGGQLDSPMASTTGNWGDPANAWDTATSSTSISYTPGGNRISISGHSTMFFKIVYPLYGSNATMTINTNWHLDFAIGAVVDGGLQITRYYDGTPASVSTYSHTNNGVTWKHDYNDFVASIDNWINSYFESNIGWLSNDLATALANQHQLCLPGSGVFMMQGAEFNERGDLLATLQYNEAPPPLERKYKSISDEKMARYNDYYKLPDHLATERLHLVPKAHAKLPERQPLVPEAQANAQPKKLVLPSIKIKFEKQA